MSWKFKFFAHTRFLIRSDVYFSLRISRSEVNAFEYGTWRNVSGHISLKSIDVGDIYPQRGYRARIFYFINLSIYLAIFRFSCSFEFSNDFSFHAATSTSLQEAALSIGLVNSDQIRYKNKMRMYLEG